MNRFFSPSFNGAKTINGIFRDAYMFCSNWEDKEVEGGW